MATRRRRCRSERCPGASSPQPRRAVAARARNLRDITRSSRRHAARRTAAQGGFDMTKTKMLGVALLVTGVAACGSSGGSSASSQQLGEKCATNADCKAGESCLANVCVPALPPDLGVALVQGDERLRQERYLRARCLLAAAVGRRQLLRQRRRLRGRRSMSGAGLRAAASRGRRRHGIPVPPFDLGAFTGGVGSAVREELRLPQQPGLRLRPLPPRHHLRQRTPIAARTKVLRPSRHLLLRVGCASS